MNPRLLSALAILFAWPSVSSASERVVRQEYVMCSNDASGKTVCANHVEDVVDPCPTDADFNTQRWLSDRGRADSTRARKAFDDCRKVQRGKGVVSCATEKHALEVAREGWKSAIDAFPPMIKLAGSDECLFGFVARQRAREDYLAGRKIIEQDHRAKFIVGWETHTGLVLESKIA